jgi:hypothetical protein
MTHLTDEELPAYLPSRRVDELRRAIGHTLVDVRRLFGLDLEAFLRATPEAEELDYFGGNSGPTELVFDGGVTHTLTLWDEQLSVVVLNEPLQAGNRRTLASLREATLVRPRLEACLGRRCSDVRIWTFQEDIESTEAKQAAITYVLDGDELGYGFYVHGSDDEDAMLFGDEISPELVASCFSIAEGRPIRPVIVKA